MPAGVPPRWQLLKSRLDAICPSGTDTLQQLWRWRSMPKEQQPFLLQASPVWRAAMPSAANDQPAPAASCCPATVAPLRHPVPALPHLTPAASLLPCTCLQVGGYDRQGMLHSLSHALWESDTTVSAD